MEDEYDGYEEIYKESQDGGGYGYVGLLVFLVVLYFLFGGGGKHEGLTAEEWFNEYDDAEYRVEQLEDKVTVLEECIEYAEASIEDSWEDAYYYLYSCDY